VGFVYSMSFRLSERSECTEKSLYKKLSPFYEGSCSSRFVGIVGFMNSMSFRLSERSECTEKSLYKKLSPFYGTKWSPLLSSTERSPDLSGKGGGLGEDLRSGGNLSHKWETIDYWLSTIDYQLSTNDYWLATIDYRLTTIDYWLTTNIYRLLTND
jgi:hypothetical protein